MDDPGKDRREFERYSLTFEAEIKAEDGQGNAYTEVAVLRNISGGGVGFATKMVERYFRGQEIHISITLPPTGKSKSTMEGQARVVRIVDEGEGSGLIGVVSSTPLTLGHLSGLDPDQ